MYRHGLRIIFLGRASLTSLRFPTARPVGGPLVWWTTNFVFRLDNSFFVFADPYDALISFIWLVAPMNVVPLSPIIYGRSKAARKTPGEPLSWPNEYCNASLHCQAMTSRFRYHHYWTGIADTTTTEPACSLDSDFWKISHQLNAPTETCHTTAYMCELAAIRITVRSSISDV